jgi:hypothetical protein
MTSKILATAGAAASRVVAPSLLERWAPAAGTLFAAPFVTAVFIGAAGLETGDKLPEITQNFQSEDYRDTGGFILILLSALCFVRPARGGSRRNSGTAGRSRLAAFSAPLGGLWRRFGARASTGRDGDRASGANG